MERLLVEGSSHYVGDNRGTRTEDDESSVVYQPMEVGVGKRVGPPRIRPTRIDS